MKSIISVLAALLLVGCQIPGSFGGSGNLQIHLPGGSQSRVAASTGPADNLVRIQLVRNGIIVPLSGKDFLEQKLAGQTVTLDGLPTGTGFQLFVSTGQYPTSGGAYFETAHYQASGLFEISAGNSTSVSVTLGAARVAVVEDAAASVHSTAASNSGTVLFFVSGADVRRISGGDPTVFANSALSNGSYASSIPGRLNSLANNDGTIYFSTTQGLYYAADGTNRIDDLPTPPNALRSGFATILGYSTSVNTNLYGIQGPGLSGGVSVGGSTWSPVTIGLYGFAANPYVAYVSTGLRTVRLTGDLLGQFTSNADLLSSVSSGVDSFYNVGEGITVATSDGTPIGPISTYWDTSYTTAYTFAGTKKGVYAGPVLPFSGAPINGTLAPVSATSGLDITFLVSLPTYYAPDSYTAAYASNTKEILIFRNSDLVDRVKSLEGLPSGDLQLEWYVDTTASPPDLYLFASGTDATVVVPVIKSSSSSVPK